MKSKAERIKQTRVPAADPALAHRLPSGQVLTERFPILHEGEVPEYERSEWTLRIWGEVDKPLTLSYDQLLAMPQSKLTCDIHCVTRWSRFDNEWTGIRLRDVLQMCGIKDQAKHVMIYGDYDYEANVPLADLLGDDIMLAHSHDGEPLTPKHGWPLRLIVPHLYFWKSVKWIRGIELMQEDRPGFWERNGFHNVADPFKEQRFSGEDIPIPEDAWEHKDFD